MKKFKHVTLLIVMAMALVGCATIESPYVDPTGRMLPNPSYTLNVIGEPIRIVFYYTAYEVVEDVDGSQVPKPIYLDFLKHHEFNTKKVKAVQLIIEVNNPMEKEYGLYQEVDLTIARGQVNTTKMQTGGEINRSKMKYRQFVYDLPFGEQVRDVDHRVSFYVKDMEVARIGHFRYHLYH